MKKKLSALVLVGVMAASTLAGCSNSSNDTKTTNAPADAKKTFTVGFDQDFPPMGFKDTTTGEYKGFDLDLAAEVAKRLDFEIQYQPIDWAAKNGELESGNIDCIWNGFTMTGLEEDYTWTEAYMKNTQVFVVKKDSGIKTLKDLAGKNVDVQTDSSAEKAIKKDAELEGSFGKLVSVAEYNTAFMELESGSTDAVAMDNIVASYQITQRNSDDFVILDEVLAEEEYGVGFKKGNTELRDKVQTTLEEMAKDGTMAKISNEWFGKDITTIGK
ncbi:polar amino acid ABC transporter, substrate-binding component [Lachnospiraceae bacterium TWA4]|nr:polar amino acid ABC transporter, substrate-binding component [Lachnospiraceae bacterium TWA4]